MDDAETEQTETHAQRHQKLVQQIVQRLREVPNTNRHTLAAELGMKQSYQFGVAFTAARDLLLAEAGIDIKPIPGTGAYEIASDKQVVRRAQRYIKKGRRAISRSVARAAAVAIKDDCVDPKLKAMARRLAENGQKLISRTAVVLEKTDYSKLVAKTAPKPRSKRAVRD